MFNPLAIWTEEVLKGLIEEGQRYFIRQTFSRAKGAFDEGIKGYYLICHYKDYAPAKEHYDALKNDANRFLYDWEDEEHKKKLGVAASRPPGYKIYSNTFMPDWERHITERIKKKIRLYIQRKGWYPKKEEGVDISFYPYFGRVMITLKFRGQQASVAFDDIENIE
jgi:hypothetical protein